MRSKISVFVLSFVLLLSTVFIPQINPASKVLALNQNGIVISKAEIMTLPASGTAWNTMLSAANSSYKIPDLENQDDSANTDTLARALVYARIGGETHKNNVIKAIQDVVNSGAYGGRALALGRELGAYVIAADIIDLKTLDPALNSQFKTKLIELRSVQTTQAGSLIDCHEDRPNNWGNMCGGSRAAIDVYLDDTTDLNKAVQVFKGWMGDRTAYASFSYGDLSWQCDSSKPVGINPKGCMKNGYEIGGAQPEEMRRSCTFTWPPCTSSYNWEGLQGALLQAIIYSRQGFNVWADSEKALKRAIEWLYSPSMNYPAASDDGWQTYVVNYYYGNFIPFAGASGPAGKIFGWSEWMFSAERTDGRGSGNTGTTTPPPPPPPTPTKPAACRADYNANGTIDLQDFQTFAQNYKKSGLNCALNIAGNDCILNIQDFAEFAKLYKVPNACV